MRIGLIIFPTDKGIQPIELGKEAEARGFDSLWFPDIDKWKNGNAISAGKLRPWISLF